MRPEMKIDKAFYPISDLLAEYRKKTEGAETSELLICVGYESGNYVYKMNIFPDGTGHDEENYRLAERIVKTLLWIVGGNRIWICGSDYITARLTEAYSASGDRAFDFDFMTKVYDGKVEVIGTTPETFPEQMLRSIPVGGHLDGCRIGFDAGGSDRKVSAVVDGECVYSEEVIWFPKLNSDPEYHYNEILTAMKTAASKMPRVDAIGVSSAGVYVDNKIKVASLFIKVAPEDFERRVKNMYLDIAAEIGAPIEVANDGDVTALSGSLSSGKNNVLGIAMGTSEAGGYINSDGNLCGWLNELAFVPVDANPDAMVDEWSGDIGCGVKYFSQDGVIKLAEMGGFKFDEGLSPAEKLKVIQKLAAEGDALALDIYGDIGRYLGCALPYYLEFYTIERVELLGRVMSGVGGDIILETAIKTLRECYGITDVELTIPDESNRRVGQSIAAASLPQLA